MRGFPRVGVVDPLDAALRSTCLDLRIRFASIVWCRYADAFGDRFGRGIIPIL